MSRDPRDGRLRGLNRWVAIIVACAGGSTLAPAQTTRFEAGIGLRETLTNNVDLQPTPVRQGDLVTEITPAFTFHQKGERTRLDASVSLPVLLYARTGSENNSIYPAVNALGDVNFFDGFLHVEGTVNVSQQFFTPFGPQPPDLSNATDNRYRSTAYSVSPYIQGTTPGGIYYELRNNNVWTNLSGSPVATNNARYTEFIARAGTPGNPRVGWDARYDYTIVRFNEQPSIKTQLFRVVPFYGVTPQLRLEASVGYESNEYTLTSSNDVIYGVGFRWRPTERTDVVGKWEHRFFGSSYLFTFDHRMPLTVWNVNLSRNITSYPQQIAQLGAGGNVSDLLNTLFLSAYPDPVLRQQAVDQFIRDRGLPPTLTQPVSLYAEQILLVQSQSATVGLVGVRNSIFFTVFNAKTEPISAAGNPLPPSLFSANDNTQTGGGVQWNNRITPTLNLVVNLSAYRTVANSGPSQKTNQGSASATLSYPFSPRTSVFVGARYQGLWSEFATEYNETAAFAGISYAFR
ncbi:MAG: TIGR03016 family PEP-CTERM system-associated outer membrane protein [Burkholderiales bacterium]|nr:TIGR03016 family PEP-CTERM system-associated outer membrane protein [Burkholderiales bacterium]